MPGTWQPLTNQPTFSASTMLLLTDGTVMCHDAGAAANGTPNWWKLTPDQFGNYVNGIWSSIAGGPNSPQFFPSAVLRDGRVFTAGGEYNGSNAHANLLTAQVYDPQSDAWTPLSAPTGWSEIGDAPCCVLPDGRVLLGSIGDNKTAIYDPVANTWTAAANKNAPNSSEETWTLLPDQTVLTVECYNAPQAEKYVIAADRWIPVGATPSPLIKGDDNEIGPALLLPDGRAFAIGATGHTALYTMPPVANGVGTWTDGPMFPVDSSGQQLGAEDAPGCLLPNGRVLCAVGPVSNSDFSGPTSFFEFDPVYSTMTAVPNAPNNGQPPYFGRMMLLPSGQVLYANGSTDVEVYTPDGMADPAWQPEITSCPTYLSVSQTYTLYGRQLNGLSQAVSYGDDATMATNYPLVRIRSLSTGQVTYMRTFNFSTMGVATGSVIESTEFLVPSTINVYGGPYELSVVANGIASGSVLVTFGFKLWKEFKDKDYDLAVKIELDQLKHIVENKNKDAVGEGDPWKRFVGDPEWVKMIQSLAERVNELNEQLEKQHAFIRAEERPAVGEAALKKTE